jgi:hypothetical protein
MRWEDNENISFGIPARVVQYEGNFSWLSSVYLGSWENWVWYFIFLWLLLSIETLTSLYLMLYSIIWISMYILFLAVRLKLSSIQIIVCFRLKFLLEFICHPWYTLLHGFFCYMDDTLCWKDWFHQCYIISKAIYFPFLFFFDMNFPFLNISKMCHFFVQYYVSLIIYPC